MIIHVDGDVIKLKGLLVENHWVALKSVVSLLLEQYPNGVIIDGSNLTEINEAGTDTFLDASNYIQTQNARVVVAGLPDNILNEIRRIPGARSQLPLAASIEEARASLAVGGAEAIPETRRKPAILVSLIGAWQKAIEFAVVQTAKKAEIHLLYVIEVSRSLPLGVPLPENEQEATRLLSEAGQMLARSGLTVRKLTTRARVGFEGLGKFAADAGPRLVVVAYPKSILVSEIGRHDVVGVLCQDAPQDVVILCVDEGAEVAQETGKNGKPFVLIPLIGAWPGAIEYAAVHAASRRAEVHLLYILQVPRTLPMDAPLQNEEKEAQQTLQEAERMLRRRGVAVRKLVARARDIPEGVTHFAAEAPPELLVAAYFKKDMADEGFRHNIINAFCHETPCDVAIYCVE